MMVTKKQDLLNEFKKSYILKKANKMAQDYQFIKGFILKQMTHYNYLLFKFLSKNKEKIDNFIEKIKINKKMDKDNSFLKDLSFIIAIPNLIRKYNNEIEVDFVFLENNFFKIETNKEKSQLQASLKELEKELSTIDISDLYKFGNFILNFLTNYELREKICIKLLNLELEDNSNKFEEAINQQFVQNQKRINTWNSIQSIWV
ncbi:hypothetical protein [Spiroplasma attinicola]|uniref:hypothetical protein n=1 Tax=Spiroplasma attinicola TaxID=2904537 RepID=UPI0020BD91D1|nr:hypothetical protein [Spiroplasma sp. JKS002669]